MKTESQSPSNKPAPDFRTYLQEVLLQRCRANPRYSLRAFARALKMESSYLSKVLSGKRPVREWLIDKLQVPLALGPVETARFKALARGPGAGSNYEALAADTFTAISDWWHYAILELTAVNDFRPDLNWIALRLDLPVPLIASAVSRLKRLGILTEESDGAWKAAAPNFTNLGATFTAAGFRNLQKGVLEKAIVALEEVPLEERDQTSMTMAVPRELIPEAKKKIQKFRRDLCRFLQPPGKRDSVYHLSVSLYPVTRRETATGPRVLGSRS